MAERECRLLLVAAGGIGALYGPLHGGANEAVIKMLLRLKSPANIPAFLEAVKDKKEKLFGFGHRVYKNFDPRAKLIQQLATDVRPQPQLCMELSQLSPCLSPPATLWQLTDSCCA